MSKSPKEAGQALLIVVLVMVVTLTVGLSVASRMVTNLRNSTDEANSQAAFSAAEAGVERGVKLNNQTGDVISGVSLDSSNNSEISKVNIASLSGDSILLNNGNPIFQDDGIDVWLSPFSDNQSQLFQSTWGGGQAKTLTVYWGTHTDSCAEPAIEIIVLSGTRLHPTLEKYAYDTCPSRRSNNSFSSGYSSGPYSNVNWINGIQTFNYKVALSVTDGLLARITPLYLSGNFGISGADLPPQGKLITSTGVAGSTTQPVARKVTFFQGYDSLPSELFYAFFTSK